MGIANSSPKLVATRRSKRRRRTSIMLCVMLTLMLLMQVALASLSQPSPSSASTSTTAFSSDPNNSQTIKSKISGQHENTHSIHRMELHPASSWLRHLHQQLEHLDAEIKTLERTVEESSIDRAKEETKGDNRHLLLRHLKQNNPPTTAPPPSSPLLQPPTPAISSSHRNPQRIETAADESNRRTYTTEEISHLHYERKILQQHLETALSSLQGTSAAYASVVEFPSTLLADLNEEYAKQSNDSNTDKRRRHLKQSLQSLQKHNEAIQEYNEIYRQYSKYEWALREGRDEEYVTHGYDLHGEGLRRYLKWGSKGSKSLDLVGEEGDYDVSTVGVTNDGTSSVSASTTASTTNEDIDPFQTLIGTHWLAIEIMHRGVLTSTPTHLEHLITLRFEDEQTISGRAGCNSYGGEVISVTSSELHVGLLYQTEIYCMEEGVMDLENSFLGLLTGGKLSYEITSDGYILFLIRPSDGEVVARFEQMPNYDSQGSNIQPTSIVEVESEGSEVSSAPVKKSGGLETFTAATYNPTITDSTLLGTHWTAQEFAYEPYNSSSPTNTPELSPASEEFPITLMFENDGRICGSTGCNNYFSSITLLTDTQLQIKGGVGCTKMLCQWDGLMEQEYAYVGLLNGNSFFYEIVGQGEEEMLVMRAVLVRDDGEESPGEVLARFIRRFDSSHDERADAKSSTAVSAGSDTSTGVVTSQIEQYSTTQSRPSSTTHAEASAAFDSSSTSTTLVSDSSTLAQLPYHVTGSNWKATKIAYLQESQSNPKSIELTPVLQEYPITLSFGPDDNIYGIAGCNTYRASLTMGSSEISINPSETAVEKSESTEIFPTFFIGHVATTRKACRGQVGEQEDAFLFLLRGRKFSFDIMGEDLLLWEVVENQDGGGDVETRGNVLIQLTRTTLDSSTTPTSGLDTESIIGTSWIAIDYFNGSDMSSILPNSTISLTFDNDKLFGNAGCNYYSGDISNMSFSSFGLGFVFWTEMACMDPGLNLQELSYLHNFEKGTINYCILDDGVLELRGDDMELIAHYSPYPADVSVDGEPNGDGHDDTRPTLIRLAEPTSQKYIDSGSKGYSSISLEAPRDRGQRRPNNGNRKKRGGLFNSFQTSPLHQGYGTHYATIWVGTPPQRKSVIVDTGSHYTAFPCKGCDNCGEEHHTDKYFDYEASSTFHALSCNECHAATCISDHCVFSQTYTEGSSWHAFEAIDKVFIGGKHISSASNPIDKAFQTDFLFGCQTRETGLFVTQLADGIMGMSAHPSTLPRVMYENGKLEHNMFAMCFRRELHVSKQGVTAGLITLGGIDTRADFSPMVYARNVATSGWFTVFVKSVFVRQNGGQSAKSDHRDQSLQRVMVDLYEMNSGKGVIVDSGTTDTYLHKSIFEPFDEVWRRVTGRAYTNTPVKISPKDLLLLPTVLIQMAAFDDAPDPNQKIKRITGLVGDLDPSSPQDILLAIPATHYMEYSPSRGLYTPRIYFTESRGGVIGANAMQGHNVLFDWENKRVGFAESTCEYQENEPQQIDEGNMLVDCMLGVPSLSVSCSDSVDLSKCNSENNADMTVFGTEIWTRIVQAPGTSQGLSCEDVSINQNNKNNGGKMEVLCDGKGICREYRDCQITCANAIASGSAGGDLSPAPGSDAASCESGTWSACDYSCTQTRTNSILMSDGKCHEEKSLEFTRPCHVQACGRGDPCRVPFVVHAIIKFRGARAHLWNKQAEESFAEAFASTVNEKRNAKDSLFGPGDVIVIRASPWKSSDDSIFGEEYLEGEDEELGMQIVVETSIFNYDASTPTVTVSSSESNPNFHTDTKTRVETAPQMGRKSIPQATCHESDLHPLANMALNIHRELARPNFVTSMLARMKNGEANEHIGLQQSSPFYSTMEDDELAKLSKVITSWTIKTDVGIGSSSEFNIDQYTSNSLPIIMLLILVSAMICYLGLTQRLWSPKREEARQHPRSQERSGNGRRSDERRRGRYSRIDQSREVASILSDDTSVTTSSATSQYNSSGISASGDMELASIGESTESSFGSLSTFLTRTRGGH